MFFKKKEYPIPDEPKPTPYTNASFFSKITYSWENSILKLGMHRPLENNDVYLLDPKFKEENNKKKFFEAWKKDKTTNESNSNLIKTMLKVYGFDFFIAGVLKLISDIANLISPVILELLLNYLIESDTNSTSNSTGFLGMIQKNIGWVYVGCIFSCQLIFTICNNYHLKIVYEIGILVRAIFVDIIYHKILKLTGKEMQTFGEGQIINLIASDVYTVQLLISNLHYLWSGPLQLIIILILLIRSLGVWSLIGFSFITFIVPFQAVVMKILVNLRKKIVVLTDHRVKKTQEIIGNIRIVKFFAWENRFFDVISEFRKKELKYTKKSININAETTAIFNIIPFFASALTFIAYSAAGNPLTAAKVFSSHALFSMLRNPLETLSTTLNQLSTCIVSFKRLINLINGKELEDITEIDPSSEYGISVINGQFSWDAIRPEDILQDDFKYKKHNNKFFKFKDRKKDNENKKFYKNPVYDNNSADTLVDISNLSSNKIPMDITEKPTGKVSVDFSDKTFNNTTKILRDPSEQSFSKISMDITEKFNNNNDNNNNNNINNQKNPFDYSDKSYCMDNFSQGTLLDPIKEQELEYFRLKNINIRIKKHSLTAIVGSVGSGKSSLINAIIGEMKRESGRVILSGTYSYCSQKAWIRNATVRDNIILSQPFDQKRYNKVIEDCALQRDFELFTHGDLTEIGERGANLSGGQKQRINLARAVYYDRDIIFMDDPLSAVDAHVSRHLFDKCIVGALANKTRVLVTHHLHILPKVDYIICMKNGQIIEQGTFKELIEKNGELARLMNNGYDDDDEFEYDSESENSNVTEHNHNNNNNNKNNKNNNKNNVNVNDNDINNNNNNNSNNSNYNDYNNYNNNYNNNNNNNNYHQQQPQQQNYRSDDKNSLNTKNINEDHKNNVDNINDKNSNNEEGKTKVKGIICEEERATGSVKMRIYKHYIKASGGYICCAFIALLIILIQMTKIGSDMWLVYWTEDKFKTSTMNYTIAYLVWNAGQILLTLFFYIFMANIGIKAAKRIHDSAISRVMHAPIHFFDSNPLGRIINRFSMDQKMLDNDLFIALQTFFLNLASTISTLVLMFSAAPILGVVILPILLVYYYVQQLFRSASRELKRINALYRSTLYANFSETMEGLPTIRAYNEEESFIKHNQLLIDDISRPLHIQSIAKSWLGIRLEFIGASLVLFNGVAGMIFKNSFSVSLLGLSLSYALQITSSLFATVRYFCNTEFFMNSTERLLYYACEIEQENPKGLNAPKEWPNQGKIQIRNLNMKYRPYLPPTLHNISLDIEANEKIGIVGRTGAGKSSIIMTLLRLVEPELDSSIMIDNISISDLKLTELRKSISIIPQEPVLFSGTIRFNLDPLNEHTDQEIWTALENSGLRPTIMELDKKLESEVSVNGGNFSVGQRQLLCLARAMIKHSRILIMDEATASVDIKTDYIIQRAIRTNFNDTTVITIAHRLNTIIDYDKVLVLDKGNVLEYDSPKNLLFESNEKGELIPTYKTEFSRLIDETGFSNAEMLRLCALGNKFINDNN